jgi:hypothetical protein
LSVPPEDNDKQVTVCFDKEGTILKDLWLRAGNHAYEIRDLKEWNGIAPMMILVQGKKIKCDAIIPNLGDELDIFLAPQPFAPEAANVLEKHTLFKSSWDTWILLFFILTSISLYFVLRKPFVRVLFLTFCIALAPVDLRTAYDHIRLVQTMQKNENWISGIQGHLREITNTMGDKAWTRDGSWDNNPPSLFRPLLHYELAEKTYVASKKEANVLFGINEEKLLVYTKKS